MRKNGELAPARLVLSDIYLSVLGRLFLGVKLGLQMVCSAACQASKGAVRLLMDRWVDLLVVGSLTGFVCSRLANVLDSQLTVADGLAADS